MSYQPEPCPRCKGSGIEPFPAGVTHQIGAPSCMACWGTGKKDSDLTARALMMSGRLYGEIHGTSNTEQAVTRTAEQSHLVALAERDALTAQVEALTAQRDEAVRLLEVNIATFKAAPNPALVLVVAMEQAIALLRGVDQ